MNVYGAMVTDEMATASRRVARLVYPAAIWVAWREQRRLGNFPVWPAFPAGLPSADFSGIR
jgi:hypothetical protein